LSRGHGGERKGLRTFGDTQNYAGVLDRKKSFGNVDIEKNGADKSGDGDEQRGGAEPQDKLQGAAIESNDGVKSIFRLAIHPAFFFLFVMTEELGPHDGCARQRSNGGTA